MRDTIVSVTTKKKSPPQPQKETVVEAAPPQPKKESRPNLPNLWAWSKSRFQQSRPKLIHRKNPVTKEELEQRVEILEAEALSEEVRAEFAEKEAGLHQRIQVASERIEKCKQRAGFTLRGGNLVWIIVMAVVFLLIVIGQSF